MTTDVARSAAPSGELPLVSTIMIFLDPGPFIAEAVDSVRAQTYARWELVLVDDGSTDGTSEWARRQAAEDPERIRYVEHAGHANQGMSASRNAGARASRGAVIAFLDADDVWEPDRLELQVALLRQFPQAGMICGPTRFWYRWEGAPADAPPDAPRLLGAEPDELHWPPRLLEGVPSQRVRTPATCSVLVHRRVFDAVGGFESALRDMYEDQAFFAKVYYHFPVYVTSACLDRYRQHAASCCAVSRQAGRYDPFGPSPAHLAFLEWLEAYFAAQHVRHRAAAWSLKKALWLYRHPSLAPLLQTAETTAGWIWKRFRRKPAADADASRTGITG